MSVNDDTPLWQRLFTNLGSDPFTLSMGWDHFSYALYDDPALVHTLMELYSDWFARAVRHICALGFDFIWAGDDIAFRSGPMIPPGFFRQFFMPYFKQVAENISLPWIFHADGNFLPLLEDLLTLGMDGPHTNEPDAVDIRQVKQLVNGRVTLVGNIDINALQLGTPDEVKALTRETIRSVGQDGRLIISSSNSLARSCRVENVLAMLAPASAMVCIQSIKHFNQEQGMKKIGILNQPISALIAGLGHGDLVVICDAGLPIPPGVPRIDLALTEGIPTFAQTVDVVQREMQVERLVIAAEMPGRSPKVFEFLQHSFPGLPVEQIPHGQFKELTRRATAIIRTGEFTPYANVILSAGVIF